MRNLSNSAYAEILTSINERLKTEILYSFAKKGYCDFYIAISNSNNNSEIFADETSLFNGPERICNKLFNDSLKTLKKSPYNLTGDFKDVVYITR